MARLAEREKKKKKTTEKGKRKTLETSGNRYWIFHGDPFPTDTGNFKLGMRLKYYDSKKAPTSLVYCIASFLVDMIVINVIFK